MDFLKYTPTEVTYVDGVYILYIQDIRVLPQGG
jgi:hypothetical protein